MTKKSFILGLFTSVIVGIPIAFIYDLIGTFIGVIVGAFVAASKKGGGAVGLLTSPLIYLSPYAIPLLVSYLQGSLDILNIVLLIGYSLIDVFIIIIAVASLVVGIIFGWIGLRVTEGG